MYTISIAHERLLTTHAVADAVIDYATALHRAGSADTVTIPVVLDDGRPASARLLITATGPMLVLPSSSTEVELPEAAAASEELRRRLTLLEPVGLDTDPAELPIELAFPDFDAYR